MADDSDPKVRAARLASELFSALDSRELRLVCAESCTGGLVSALLAANSGASRCLCGSFVTYREQVKIAWLSIPTEQIVDPGAVSAKVTELMARAALERTPDADLSVAVTGHLDPASAEQGQTLAWVATCSRSNEEIVGPEAVKHLLVADSRTDRQYEAAAHALEETIRSLQ